MFDIIITSTMLKQMQDFKDFLDGLLPANIFLINFGEGDKNLRLRDFLNFRCNGFRINKSVF